MSAPYLYSELPDVVDRHVARLLCEAFALYGKSGHRNHVLYLDRASGAYSDIVAALAMAVRTVHSFKGSLAFITRRKDMRELLSASGLQTHVFVYQSEPVPPGAKRRKALQAA